jgi:hypothetical protein
MESPPEMTASSANWAVGKRLILLSMPIALALHITVQIQQSHSSSPQSHPKHGFDTVLIGFLIELPELEEGRTQLIGDAKEVTIVDLCLRMITTQQR